MATLKIRHGNQWVPVQVVAYLNDLANQYDPMRSYSAGDYCAHEMRLFKATKPTTGVWDATAWEHIVVTDEITQQLTAGDGIHIIDGVVSADPLTGEKVKSALGYSPVSDEIFNDTIAIVDKKFGEIDDAFVNADEAFDQIKEDLSDLDSKLSESITEIEDVLFKSDSEIVEVDFDVYSSRYLKKDGTIAEITGANYKVSSLIDVSNTGKLYITASASWGNGIYAFYDENGGVVGIKNSESSGTYTLLTDELVIVPTSAKTLVIAWSSYQNSGSVKKEDDAGTFVLRKKWDDKKWVCVGDSLTEVNARTTMHYHDYIHDATGIEVVNMGVSGSGYKCLYDANKAFYQRVSAIPMDADVITIFGSGNDCSPVYGFTLGTATDTGTDTLGGCINKTIDTIYERCPLAILGIISPCPWDTHRPSNSSDMMYQYSNLLKDICALRGIPFLDLFRCSGMRPWEASYRALVYTKDGGSGTHPDETGHKILAPHFKAFLNTLIL